MVTQPEKEEQLLRYIEENAHRGKWSKLTLHSLIEKFADRNFPKDVLKKIINGLENKEVIVSKRLEYNFYCLENMGYEVDKKLLRHNSVEKIGPYVISFVIYFLLLRSPGIFNRYTNFIQGSATQLSPWTFLFSGFITSFLFILALGKIIQKCWLVLKREDSSLIRYHWMLYAYGILALIAIILYFGLKGGSYDVSPITLFYSTLVAGTAINALIHNVKKDDKKRK